MGAFSRTAAAGGEVIAIGRWKKEEDTRPALKRVLDTEYESCKMRHMETTDVPTHQALFAEANALDAEARAITAAAVARLTQPTNVRHGVEVPVTYSGLY